MTKRNRNPSYEDVLGIVENTSKPIKGIDEPKIIGDIEVIGGSGWGWGMKIKYFELNINTPWIISYEWFWFKPKWYIIQAWSQGNQDYAASSYWTYIEGVTKTFYSKVRAAWAIESDYNSGQYSSSSFIISITEEDDSTSSNARHEWFTDDWILLNWTLADTDVNFTIIAYS